MTLGHNQCTKTQRRGRLLTINILSGNRFSFFVTKWLKVIECHEAAALVIIVIPGWEADQQPAIYRKLALIGIIPIQILFFFISDKELTAGSNDCAVFFSSDPAVSFSIFVGAEREENLTRATLRLNPPSTYQQFSS